MLYVIIGGVALLAVLLIFRAQDRRWDDRSEVRDAAERFAVVTSGTDADCRSVFSIPYRDEESGTTTLLATHEDEGRLSMIRDDRRRVWWALYERAEGPDLLVGGTRGSVRAEATFKRKRGRRLLFDELLDRASRARVTRDEAQAPDAPVDPFTSHSETSVETPEPTEAPS